MMDKETRLKAVVLLKEIIDEVENDKLSDLVLIRQTRDLGDGGFTVNYSTNKEDCCKILEVARTVVINEGED